MKILANISKSNLTKAALIAFAALLIISLGFFLNDYELTLTPRSTSTVTSSQESPIVKTNSNTLYAVTHVVDGDTIDVNIDGQTERLRLIGMDTPETVDPRKPVQCFGKEASNKAKELLTDKKVYLEADSTQGERDKYGRLLRYVFMGDHESFEKYMIENGYAHEYTYNLPYKYQDEFKQAEKTAREQNKGLWSPSMCNGNLNTFKK